MKLFICYSSNCGDTICSIIIIKIYAPMSTCKPIPVYTNPFCFKNFKRKTVLYEILNFCRPPDLGKNMRERRREFLQTPRAELISQQSYNISQFSRIF